MDWKLIAILAPTFFVAYQALSKLLPRDVSTFLVNAYASLIGAVVMLAMHLLFSANKSLALTSKYLSIALGIGLLISGGNYMIIKAYSLGAPQTLFTAVFYPALIIYATLVGLLIWHEKLNIAQGAGITLSLIGILMIFYYKK